MYAIRREVADFIQSRDSRSIRGEKPLETEVDPENIFLTKGGSNAVEMILQCMLSDSNDSILVPIPQYPLYSALISVYGGHMQGYFLNEDYDSQEWSLDVQHI